MKKAGLFSLFTLIILALMACGPNKAEQEKKQEDELAKQVLAVHDEVMPKMGELSKLRKQLKEKVNTWTETAVDAQAENIGKATQLIADLDAADAAMMDWMHTYNGGQGLYDHDAIMEYLNEEMVKITSVKEQMNNTMELAKSFLETNSVHEPIVDTAK